MRWLRQKSWPWWQVGLLLGVLEMFAFYTANYYLSTSTTFSRAAGMLVGLVAPEHVAANAYYQQVKPVVDWQFMPVIGLILGAFASASLSGDFKASWVPSLWEARFGRSRARRWGLGLLGGALLGFGARFADGCTSGHALSGGLQLALSGWVSMLFFFVGGIGTALWLYGRGGVTWDRWR